MSSDNEYPEDAYLAEFARDEAGNIKPYGELAQGIMFTDRACKAQLAVRLHRQSRVQRY